MQHTFFLRFLYFPLQEKSWHSIKMQKCWFWVSFFKQNYQKYVIVKILSVCVSVCDACCRVVYRMDWRVRTRAWRLIKYLVPTQLFSFFVVVEYFSRTCLDFECLCLGLLTCVRQFFVCIFSFYFLSKHISLTKIIRELRMRYRRCSSQGCLFREC